MTVMLLAFAFTSASAYDFEAGGLYYNIKSTLELTASVCGLADSSIVDLKIPSTVTYKSRTLKVTAIDGSAFSYCSELQEVDLPSSLTIIEGYTFYKCKKLRRCDLRYVEHIGKSAFEETRLEKIYLQKCSELGRCAFKNMRNLREIAIQSELKLIPKDCFEGCKKLQEISLPNSLKRIEDDAFCVCI